MSQIVYAGFTEHKIKNVVAYIGKKKLSKQYLVNH